MVEPKYSAVFQKQRFVNSDELTVCQAIYKGIESEEWKRLCYSFVDMHKVVTIRKPGNNHMMKNYVDVERCEVKWRNVLRSQ